jgi:type I restriction enzyme S subunit
MSRSVGTLPGGWQSCLLSEIALPGVGQIRPGDFPGQEFNYLSLDALPSGGWLEPIPEPVKGSEVRSTCIQFDDRHVLYAKLRPYLNKVVVPTREGIGSTEFVPLLPDQNVVTRSFLAWYLRSPQFVEYAVRNSTGARMPRIRMAALWEAEIPLPPLDEQRRIVARIETLFACIAEAWRLRIAAEEDAVRLIGSVRDDLFRELDRSVSTKPQLGNIAESRLGKMLSKEAKKGARPRPYLRNANVQWDCIDLDDLYEMDFDEREEEKYGLQSGDLLVCEGGEIGRAAVWQGELKECYFQKALHRVRLRDSRASPRYLMHFIAWASTNGAIAELRTGSAIPHLTGIRLKTLEIIWPTASEQHRIVDYLDGVQAQVAELKRLQAASAAELEQLGGAVLARAFQGEL